MTLFEPGRSDGSVSLAGLLASSRIWGPVAVWQDVELARRASRPGVTRR